MILECPRCNTVYHEYEFWDAVIRRYEPHTHNMNYICSQCGEVMCTLTQPGVDELKDEIDNVIAKWKCKEETHK